MTPGLSEERPVSDPTTPTSRTMSVCRRATLLLGLLGLLGLLAVPGLALQSGLTVDPDPDPGLDYEEWQQYVDDMLHQQLDQQRGEQGGAEDGAAGDEGDEDNQVLDRWLNIPGFGFFDDCINPPPECPNSNITFWLYTRETGDNPEQLDVEKLTEARWSQGRPVKVLIHGYTGDKDYSPNTEIRPAYLNYSDYNVISVDWNPLALSPCYVQATYNVALVGNCTAQLVDGLVQQGVATLEDVHIVGFSLGAQVAGHMANYMQTGRLTRITGLDPAMPLFVTWNRDARLDESDADFVDVVHTNAGFKGKLLPVGHIDFYLNSIIDQPGCSWDSVCDHARAPAYFAESISSPQGFWGWRCSNMLTLITGMCKPEEDADMVLMGEHTNTSARGIYFAYTNPNFPFAKGPDFRNFTMSVVHNELSTPESED